jgi:hypothetical protein
MTELTTLQVADRYDVARQTVALWCRRGLLSGAREVDAGRGPVWLIPESALEGFTPPKPTGRPPKPKTAQKSARESSRKSSGKK